MKTRRGPIGRGYSRKSRTNTRPLVERVEDRLLLTTYFVNNTGDNGPGSLRDAITMSNADTKTPPNVIDFSQLPAGLNTIMLQSPLPQITASVTIDGTTAPGYVPTSPKPTLAIDGNRASTGPILDVASNGVTIQSLDINNFGTTGITYESGNNGVIAGNYIGLDLTGIRAGTNSGTGILVNGGNVLIGGTTAAARNVITGVNQGVQFNSVSPFGTLQGNYIGTNAQGTAQLGTTNKGNGVELDSGFHLIDNNLISGYSYGIQILNNSAFNTVSGNFIGTDFSGDGKIGNSFDGIYINASPQNIIGTYENATNTGLLGSGNVISGNGRDGIQLTGFSPFVTIQSNKIGIGADNTTRLGNGFYGILFNGGGGSSTIGGADFQTNLPNEVSDEAAKGNVIAYNGGSSSFGNPAGGILITGGQSNDGILTNSIFSNVGPGIQLNGANNGVIPPTIDTALAGGGQTKISGSLFERSVFETYRIQLFSTSTNGNGEGKTFLGDFDVTTDSLGNATFNITLPTQAPIGSYLTATATERATFINNSSIFSQPVQIGQAVVADIAVTVLPIATDPATPLVGQPYIYAVTVTNNPGGVANNDNATGVILTNTLPANSILVPGSTTAGYTLSKGVLTYNIGNLADKASQTFFIAVKPSTTTGKFTDAATVTSDVIDSNLTNNADSNTPANGVQPDATLTTFIIPSTNPTPVGTPLNYVVTVSNQGPSTANNSVVTITLDPSFTNIIVTPDQGTFSVTGNVVTVNTGILPSGSGSTITLTVTPTAVGTFTTTSSVTSSIINPTTGTNTSVITKTPVTVANSADLGVSLSAPTQILVGNQLVYTVTVTNNGPSTATTPVVGDLLPQGLTYDPAGSSDSGGGTLSLNNGVVLATLKPIPSGGTDIIKIAVTPTVSGKITNSVVVADPDTNNPSEIDTDLTNNVASATTLISPADVGVTIINPADPLIIGTKVAYQVQVFNMGPADATNVTLVDTLGPGATIVSSSTGTITTPSGGNVLTANLGTIASGSMMTITIMVDPTSSVQLADQAVVSSDQVDPNPNNNVTSTSNLVNPVDLAVSVAAPTTPVIFGNPITFTVTVKNNGPATATGVMFTGNIPAGTTYLSATPSQGSVSPSGSSLTGDLGTLASGQSATVTIQVLANSVASFTETASVTSADIDTDSTNDSASATVSVTNLPGTIEVATALTILPENSGSVILTLNRINGSLGAVTVGYSTFGFTAVAGVNYKESAGIVTFADGQTTATVSIPVLDDGIVNGDKGFFFALIGATGGALIDANDVTAIDLTNVDRDLIPPTVAGITAIANGTSVNGFTISFSKPLDGSRANDVSNYHVFLSNHDAGKGVDASIPLAAAVYNPLTNSVTLIPTAVLPGNRFYHVIVNGSYGNAVTDTSGNLLSGSGGANTNYDVYYGRGTSLRYVDALNNAVTVKVSGPGTVEIIRASGGDASDINLTGISAHKTRLTGSVKKLARSSSGHTTIGTITGLGHFGDVRSSLTTPGFYVLNPPVFTPPGIVSASSVSLPTVTVARKTVKGPLAR